MSKQEPAFEDILERLKDAKELCSEENVILEASADCVAITIELTERNSDQPYLELSAILDPYETKKMRNVPIISRFEPNIEEFGIADALETRKNFKSKNYETYDDFVDGLYGVLLDDIIGGLPSNRLQTFGADVRETHLENVQKSGRDITASIDSVRDNDFDGDNSLDFGEYVREHS